MAPKPDLTKVKLGYSSDIDEIVLFRHGKDPSVLLDKRNADADVIAAIIAKLTSDDPEGGSMVIELGAETYELIVRLRPGGEDPEEEEDE